MATVNKVMIIGLDCFEPSFVFDLWRNDLPTLSKLMKNGIYGKLESTLPAITVPAWMSMMTSRNPGTLGFYGFRNRKDYSYDELSFANSTAVKVDTVWKILGRYDRKSILLSVPQTYPPKPVNGCLIGCFLTPNTDSDYTYPSELKEEIKQNIGEYIIDVKDFRTEDKEKLLKQIYYMTEQRFKLANYLLDTKPWDLFMMVEMGPDRIHHGMWKYFDETHVNHIPNSPYKNAIRDYYIEIDRKIADILKKIDMEHTAILVVSDHGAKRMDGGFCFNDWLINEGYLSLKTPIEESRSFKNSEIDWSTTKVWGSGGYYGRLFINVEGREPQGIVPQSEYQSLRRELKMKLEAILDHTGKPMKNRAFLPQEIYPEVNGIAPDLIVYFGDLGWRSVGTVGNKSLYVFENDTGPDDANHSQHGMFILSVPHRKIRSRNINRQVMDIAPTVLNLLGIEIPPDMEGKAINIE
jgi:predicted AlkP superfamily phosphohydrolase/phosphomutase